MRIPCLVAGAALAFMFGRADAAVRDWPSATCSGTLQACINGAASGDTVRIVTLALIDEDLSIVNRSLTLSSRGAAARFALGRNIVITASNNGVSTTLENLWVQGEVSVDIGSPGAADTQTVVLDNLRVTPPPTISNGVRMLSNTGALSTQNFTLRRSRIDLQATVGTAVDVSSSESGGRPVVNISNNQINAGLSGIAALVGATNGLINIQGNRVSRLQNRVGSGGTSAFGIFVGGNGGGTTPSQANIFRNVVFHMDIGISATANSANLNARLINNTVAQVNFHGLVMQRTTGFVLNGRVANNIVDSAGNCGLFLSNTGGPAVTANFNLYSRNADNVCGGTLGANDVVSTALFEGAQDFRLRNFSPGIDVGSNADQPSVPIIVPVPAPDFDSRAGRVGSTVDMGAFEHSFEASFEHVVTSTNLTGNYTRIDQPPFTLFAIDALQVGQFGRIIDGVTPLPTGSAAHLGAWFEGPNWAVFNQSTLGSINLGRRFFILNNLNSNQNLLATASAGNTAANVLTLDHPQLNNQPDAIPLVTQRWDPDGDGSGTYNNSSVGVWYNPAVNRWTVFNQQPVGGFAPNIPLGASFQVMIANPLFATGSHAYRTESLGVPVSIFSLDHPLINNNACAMPLVSAVYNPNNIYVPANLLLSYNPSPDGRGVWAIERGDGQQIPAGAAFHVYIDPQRSRRCQDEGLQWDGFE